MMWRCRRWGILGDEIHIVLIEYECIVCMHECAACMLATTRYQAPAITAAVTAAHLPSLPLTISGAVIHQTVCQTGKMLTICTHDTLHPAQPNVVGLDAFG